MISIEQACINVLKTFLQTNMPDVTVTEEWPDPDLPLPERAISILKIGEREETKIDPSVVSSAPYLVGEPPAPDPILRSYVWRVKLVSQRIQLDVWSRYQAVRDDMHARLDGLLNSGPAVTFAAPTIDDADFRDGPLLALNPADGFTGFVDFSFGGPRVEDDPESVKRNEFRATRLGSANAVLTVTKTQPSLKEIDVVITDDGGSFSFTVDGDS